MNKTSEEWQKLYPEIKVLDPDGWDKQNFQYSWFEEKITLIEYTSRLHRSTVKGIIPKEEPKQETLEEASNKYSQQGSWQCPISFEEGAKWQSERIFNQLTDDVIDDWLDYRINNSCKISLKEWFEQFKKK